MPQNGSTLFALNIGISIKHDNNENSPDTFLIRNDPVQRVKVQESIQHNCAWLSAKAKVQITRKGTKRDMQQSKGT